MRPSFFVKDTVADVACEQALCLGKKNREERDARERGKEAFSLFPLPSSPLDWRLVHRQFQPLCGWKSKLGQKAHRSLRISKNFLQLPLFLEDFVSQYQGELTEGSLMYLLKTVRLTSTILDKIRWKICPSSILWNKRWGNGTSFAWLLSVLILGQRGLSFPVNICPRIVRVCKVLSVLVPKNSKKLSSPFFYRLRSNFSERILGRENSFRELIHNSRKYRILFILPSHHQNMSRNSIQGL